MMNQNIRTLHEVTEAFIYRFQQKTKELGVITKLMAEAGIIDRPGQLTVDYISFNARDGKGLVNFFTACGYYKTGSYYRPPVENLPRLIINSGTDGQPYPGSIGFAVHDLPPAYNRMTLFTAFLRRNGVEFEGPIQKTNDNLLFQNRTISSIGFTERRVLPQYRDMPPAKITCAHRREGFVHHEPVAV